MAALHLALEDALKSLLLVLEHDGFAAEGEAFFAGDLAESAAGAEVAAEDDQVAVFLDGVVEAPNDVLPGRIARRVAEVFGHCLAGDGHHVAVEQALVQEHFHQGHCAADFHQAGHDVLARGLEVGQHGHPLSDAGPVVDGELHAGAVGHADEVHHRIGRSAEGNHHRHGILERLLGHDVARADVLLEQIQDGGTGVFAIAGLFLRHGRLRGRVRQAHAQSLDG